MAVTGLLGTKVGMTQVWDEDNRVVPVTVVEIGPNVVTQVRTPETDGYSAVQLGYGAIDPRKVTKPMAGHFGKAGVTPRRHVIEADIEDATEVTPGDEFDVSLFEAGSEVDVTGITKGKGYSGVMKRHGFHGQRASHGAHKVHRAPGSIGACATPGRVFKGMKMAGRGGGQRQTTLNLAVERVDTENNVLLIKGAVPGNNGSVVFVRKAKKGGEGSQA